MNLVPIPQRPCNCACCGRHGRQGMMMTPSMPSRTAAAAATSSSSSSTKQRSRVDRNPECARRRRVTDTDGYAGVAATARGADCRFLPSLMFRRTRIRGIPRASAARRRCPPTPTRSSRSLSAAKGCAPSGSTVAASLSTVAARATALRRPITIRTQATRPACNRSGS